MNKINIKKLAEAVLFETLGEEPKAGYVDYGKFDRPISSDPMLKAELPISTNAAADTSSLLNLPPIDDPDYTPTTRMELKLALYALAENVNDDMIEKFYHRIKKQIDDANSHMHINSLKESIRSLLEANEDETMQSTNQPPLVKKSRSGKRRPGQPSYKPTKKELAAMIASGIEEPYMPYGTATHSNRDYTPDIEMLRADKKNKPMDYSEMAGLLGYSGASGARQYVEWKIENFFKNLLENIKNNPESIESLDNLRFEALEEFLDLMDYFADEENEDRIFDQEDVVFMQQNPKEALDSEAFRYWLNNAYLEPAKKNIRRSTLDEAARVVEDLSNNLNAELNSLLTSQSQKISPELKSEFDVYLKRLKTTIEHNFLKQSSEPGLVEKAIMKFSEVFSLPTEITNSVIKTYLEEKSAVDDYLNEINSIENIINEAFKAYNKLSDTEKLKIFLKSYEDIETQAIP